MHEMAVKKWQEECNCLRAGTLVKDLSKKPLHKTKAELKKKMGLENENDNKDNEQFTP